jgi:hypothetical protein
MPTLRQGDLFRNDEDSEERETPTWYPDPDEVRADLQAIPAPLPTRPTGCVAGRWTPLAHAILV